MSQIPDKIWLHKDTKYNTGDTVCGYQYEFAQGIEDEGGIENFVKYVPADAFIEKVCAFIRERLIFDDNAWYTDGEVTLKDKVIEDLKKYMYESK